MTHYGPSILPGTVSTDFCQNCNDGDGIHLWSDVCKPLTWLSAQKITRIYQVRIQVRHSNLQTSSTNTTDSQPTHMRNSNLQTLPNNTSDTHPTTSPAICRHIAMHTACQVISEPWLWRHSWFMSTMVYLTMWHGSQPETYWLLLPWNLQEHKP
jgi:hypothetical protein